ncbi:MAG: YdiU family protein [Cocleimonas sp.]
MKIPFNNTYIKLPTSFYTKLAPTPVKSPELIIFNSDLAETLGITEVNTDASKLAAIFSGNEILQGSEPLAMVYAGHQFGGFSHQLGDGRANLLGEVVTQDKMRYDIQLKGSGPTPYSRGGDGRSALGPVLREYLVSEAMHKLGVPTTRSLAAVTTGEEVARNSLVPGGILTRVAKGFVRVGTFEYFSARRDIEAIKTLADYEINRHYPEAIDASHRYVEFFKAVVNTQAKLIAKWMSVGFIHGVMNTDNMSIAGETIDYGPCAFMDDFSHSRIYSSIDHNLRYAYSQQAKIAQWNLVRLAETLLPLFVEDDEPDEAHIQAAVEIAQEVLKAFQIQYEGYWLENMRKKIGLECVEKLQQNDEELINELLDCMEKNSADFTLTFYHLSQLENSQTEADKDIRKLFDDPEQIDTWLVKWRKRLAEESAEQTERQLKMQTTNPVYIPRNHQIEVAIRAAEDNNDFSVFHDLHTVLQTPFTRQKGKERYMLPPLPEEVVHQTFCGT